MINVAGTPISTTPPKTEVIDCHVLESLQEVRSMTEGWLHRYSHHRPHESAGRTPPVACHVKRCPNLCF
ncbi:MAG: hypothetical protein E2585_01570 [Comamonas sp.]|jgi:putative transposase|uniref:integrase core domain-containing protein n=1 Tax=Comamonas TaxID=283 RepID=UPI0009B842E0|nr:hypothetical protein [Comamonas sp.]